MSLWQSVVQNLDPGTSPSTLAKLKAELILLTNQSPLPTTSPCTCGEPYSQYDGQYGAPIAAQMQWLSQACVSSAVNPAAEVDSGDEADERQEGFEEALGAADGKRLTSPLSPSKWVRRLGSSLAATPRRLKSLTPSRWRKGGKSPTKCNLPEAATPPELSREHSGSSSPPPLAGNILAESLEIIEETNSLLETVASTIAQHERAALPPSPHASALQEASECDSSWRV